MTTEYKVLDLFSGCGGLSLGLHWAKSKKGSTFKTIAASDIWATASATYEQNLGISPYTAPISKDLVKKILKDVGPVDIVVGGPPCQGFSTSGKRSLDDPRNQLVVAYLDAIAIAKPKAFLMENVSGFTTFQDGKLLQEVKSIAEAMGYTVRTGIVQASLVGVPQRRRRFMMVGMLNGNEFIFPGETPKASKPKIESLDVDLTFRDGEEEWTLWDAISDLPVIEAGETTLTYTKKPQNALQTFLRAGESGLTMHSAVNHKKEFVEMMSYIPQGKSALDPEVSETIPSAIRPKSGYPNSYSRLRPAMTLREGARCQSFPDDFRFLGKPEEIRLQIGNAVPPLLAKAVGESILNCLETS